MRPAGWLFVACLAGAGVALLMVTFVASVWMGLASAAPVFVADFLNPWRAQFHTDFGLCLLLIAGWMVLRARSWPAGLVCAALALLLGSLFILPYLAIVVVRAKGDLPIVLLGSRRREMR